MREGIARRKPLLSQSPSTSARGGSVGDHLCLLFNDEKAQVSAAARYIANGFERGERVLYVADKNGDAAIRAELQAGGIDVERQRERGALRMVPVESAYLRYGVFEPDRMVNLLRDEADGALRDGFSGVRISGEMSWALGPVTGRSRLLEYEAKVDTAFGDAPISALCQYDVRRFDPAVLPALRRLHSSILTASRQRARCHCHGEANPGHRMR